MRLLFASVLAAAATLTASAEPAAPRPAGELVVNMPDGSQKLLSSYKGKPVCLAFFLTTCPHCQDMARLLSSQIVPEYSPKGVQFLAAAFDDNVSKSAVQDFANNYAHNVFPVGSTDRGQMLELLQKSIMTPLFVPIMVFIDRKGLVVDQFIGDSTFLADPPKNVRAELDKILARPGAAAPAHKPVTHLSKK